MSEGASTRVTWRIVNSFVHDLATGTWFACLLVTLVLRGHLDGAAEAVESALRSAMQSVLVLALVSLLAIASTGAVRLLYWRSATPAAELAEKRRLLIIKHIAFLLVYGLGTVWLYLQVSA